MKKRTIWGWNTAENLNIPEAIAQSCYVKKWLENFFKAHRKIYAMDSFYSEVASLNYYISKKMTSSQVFSCEFLEILQNICSIDHLRAATSDIEALISWLLKWK